VVEHSAADFEIVGSNPATTTGKKYAASFFGKRFLPIFSIQGPSRSFVGRFLCRQKNNGSISFFYGATTFSIRKLSFNNNKHNDTEHMATQ
jgi:hypothetical protein